MIGANTVDPGADFVSIDIAARTEFGAGLGNAFGFPREASLPLGLVLDAFGNWGRLDHGLNINLCRALL